MKKVLKPTLTAKGVDAALEMLRRRTDYLSENTFYGVVPVQDQESHNTITYEGLGDAATAREEIMRLNFFGNVIELPIGVSNYIEVNPKSQSPVKKETKTLRFGSDKLLDVINSTIDILKYQIFYFEHVSIPLFGLTPEFQNISENVLGNTTLAIFGEAMLDGWCGDMTRKGYKSQEAINDLSIFSSAMHTLTAINLDFLKTEVAKLESAREILTKKIETVNTTADIISEGNFQPVIPTTTSKSVNLSEFRKPDHNILGRFDSTIEGSLVNTYDNKITEANNAHSAKPKK